MLLQYKSTVTDPAISGKLAAFWEGQFFDDMHRLRVRDPDTITRVTEYVPEIVSFVERIISNGYAYEAEGSVYFDTLTFDRADGHSYAKLEPWSKGNRELLEGGEGNHFPSFCLFSPTSSHQDPCQVRQAVDQPQTSLFGKLRNLVNHFGHLLGERAVQVGILSVQSWQALS